MGADDRPAEPPPKRWARVYAITVLALIGAGFVYIGHGCWCKWTFWTRPEPIRLESITRLTGISFPDSARLVGSALVRVPRSLEAKLYIDRADLETFKESHRGVFGWTASSGFHDARQSQWWEPPSADMNVEYSDWLAPRPSPEDWPRTFAGATIAVAARDADTAIVYVFSLPQ